MFLCFFYVSDMVHSIRIGILSLLITEFHDLVICLAVNQHLFNISLLRDQFHELRKIIFY